MDLATAYAEVAPVRGAALRDCWRRCPAWVSRDDLAQMEWEALGALLAKYEPRPGIPPGVYLRAAYRWELLRCVRRTWQTYRSRLEGGPAVLTWPHDLLMAPDAGPQEAPDYGTAAACAELLRHLPARERHALWLHAVEGLPLTAVAQRLGVSRATAYAAYRRAVALARAFWTDSVA